MAGLEEAEHKTVELARIATRSLDWKENLHSYSAKLDWPGGAKIPFYPDKSSKFARRLWLSHIGRGGFNQG